MEALPENIAGMKVADLKKELKSRGLSVTGNKTELIERLQMAAGSSGTVGDASVLEEDDTALLEEADDILGEDDDTPVTPAPEKKKVAINRESKPEAAAATPAKPEASKDEDGGATEHKEVPQTTPTGKRRITAPSDDDSSAKKQVKVIGGQVESESSPVKADDSTLASDNAVKSDAPMTDAEKAAKRAARFGVTPTVTSQSQKSARAERFGLKNVSNGSSKIGSAPSADLETLKKRAERFGQSSSNTMKKLEADELIKKRQERFGKETAAAAGSGTESAVKTKSKVSPNESLLVDEKIKKRAERFGTEIKAT